jgi:hypothetical protein
VLERGTVGPHAVHQVAELSISVEVTRKADPIGFFQSRFHPTQQLTELSTTYPRVILTKQPQTSSPTQSADVVQGGVQCARDHRVFQITQITEDQSRPLPRCQTVHRQRSIGGRPGERIHQGRKRGSGFFRFRS